MSASFLHNFMQAAQGITRAQRCLAMSSEMAVLTSVNIDEKLLTDGEFLAIVQQTIQDALSQEAAIISNNLITDPADAPQTNVHLTDLRMIVAIPLTGYGAVYLDQHVKQGVFERDMIDKISLLAQQVIAAGEINLSADELKTRYEQL